MQLRFLQHFVVFETKKGKTVKKIARYQQFEAVNELVDRTVSLAGQLADRRIRVNCIAPGYVYTPMVSGQMTDETRQRRRLAGLLPDEGTAFDVGWAAVYLACDESSWVTGQVLFVDGGLTVATRRV